MNGTLTIMRRELRSYFSTPLAYVFIVIFLVLLNILRDKEKRLCEGRSDSGGIKGRQTN